MQNEKPLPPRLEDVDAEDRVNVGGPIDESKVSLRIMGEELDPHQLTDLLSCEPTISRKKGDVIPSEKYLLTAPIGIWSLESPCPKEASVEDKIVALLNCVTSDVGVWKRITSMFTVDIFCGLFLKQFNRGFELSPTAMKLVYERGIKLGFDIYYSASG